MMAKPEGASWRLHYVTLATHAACSALGAAATALVFLTADFRVLPWLAAAFAFGLAAWMGWMVAGGVLRGLRLVERVACQTGATDVASSRVREFNEAAQRLREYVHRKAVAESDGRQQLREVTALIGQMDRRPPNGTGAYAAGQQLRQVLVGVSSTIDAELKQLLGCSREIEACMREITGGAEQQSDALSKTTTYVEQISTNLEAVSKNADATHDAASTTRQTAEQTLDTVRLLVDKMERIHSEVETSEAKLLGLGDRSQEISSTVERIREIASRTNLLALNASIESVRAGEHGRGFAVVAQEVRALAEQSGQAAREISSLIEAVQLENQGLIAEVTNECTALEAEIRRARAAAEDIERIGRVSNDAMTSLGEISFAAQHQLKLTQDLVMAVDRIADVAKRSRSCSEKAAWTTKTLAKTAQQFDESVAPLRRCSSGREPAASNRLPLGADRGNGESTQRAVEASFAESGDPSANRVMTTGQASLPTG
jgi:methyl-accepting chemotaxis protein